MGNKRTGGYASDDDPRYAHLSENAKGTPTYAEKIEGLLHKPEVERDLHAGGEGGESD